MIKNYNLSKVLLISGGESLEPEERVCKYTAGSSDTNPIFLFSMVSIESSQPPETNVDCYSEAGAAGVGGTQQLVWPLSTLH